MGLRERVQDNGFVRQVREAWGRMPPARRWIAVGTAAAVVGLLAWIIATGSKVEYGELMRGADTQDLAAVRDALEAKGIPYQLGDGGTIRVPKDQIHQARLDVAQAGLPSGGSVGFEIFDEQDFWANTFSQRVNFHRALEGELSRTVTALDEVKAARVHLVIPKPALFKEEQKKPTASIVVRLKAGRHLDDSQVQGLRLLVASAVEAMSPDDVTVLDSAGVALARPGPEGSLGSQERRLEFTRSYEASLESRIQSMLEPVAGQGRVIARVTADLDFTSRRETVEEFDSENPAVRSERRTTESSGRSKPPPSGVPGSRGNLQGQAQTPAATEKSNRQDELVNYELNKTMRHRDEPPGRVRRLSVAVVLAGRPVQRAPEAEAPPKQEFVPFSDEELARFETVVKSAVGFDSDRGDVVEVTNMPFRGIEEEAMLTEPMLPPSLIERMLDWGFVLLLLAALYFAVVRPLMARPGAEKSQKAEEAEVAKLAGRTEGDEKALAHGAETDESRLLESGEEKQEKADETADGAETPQLDGEAAAAARARALGSALDLDEDADSSHRIPAALAVRLRERAIELSRADGKRAAQVIRGWLQTEEQRAER